MKQATWMCLVLAACGGGSAAKPPVTPAPNTDPTPETPVPDGPSGGNGGDRYEHDGRSVAGVLVERGGDDGAAWDLTLTFASGDREAQAVTLANGTGDGCDNVSFFIEPVVELDDPRLAMVNLLCDRGADYIVRDVVTALLFVGDAKHAPAVLWEGTGSFQSEMDACATIDVAYFRKGAAAIEAVQWTEVQRIPDNPLPEGGECNVEPRRDSVRATIDVPR